jgi:glucosamine 6-phosphate synthetase-like amidotransferase/phosphosugar isomerase protein
LAQIAADYLVGGTLKHGVMPSPKNSTTLHAKLLSNIREVRARGAISIVIAEEADEMVSGAPSI